MHIDRRLFDGKVQSSVVYPEFFRIEPTDSVVNLGCGVAPQAVVYKDSFKRMVGVDLHEERLEASKTLLAEKGVTGYETVCAPVEKTGLPDASFEKALAIDIIEHLPDPAAFLEEAYRLLKPKGQLLLSVPSMHDIYTHSVKAIARTMGRKTHDLPQGHWDAHNSDHSLRVWMNIIAKSPFSIVKTRATTLFPPLHLYGLPRFWFTNPVIHTVDSAICRIPLIKRFGQASLIILEKQA